MKKVFYLLLLAVFTQTACTRINPGMAGFKINYSGDYRGTDSVPLATGWVWYTPGYSTVIEFPTYMQHVVWTADKAEGSDANQEISIGCRGGAGFLLDIGINYTIQANKVSHLYFKFKTDDLESISNSYIRNTTRKVLNDLAGTYTMDSLLNCRPQFEHDAQINLEKILSPDGIIISQLSILTTPRSSDPNIAQSIANKIKAKQDAETSQMQLQQSVAEANKKVATARGDSASIVIAAKGQSIANEKLQAALTPLLLNKMWIEKWNGDLPKYMLGGNSSALIQLPNNK